MNEMLSTLVRRLSNTDLSDSNVIPWSCPVPSFGDLSSSRIATLGLNPSNREFVDDLGNELDGPYRRFHTLKSLGLSRWSDADKRHVELISDSCRAYFSRNPYDRWFKKLDYIISGTTSSYYGTSEEPSQLDLIPYATIRKERACHLDLIPYATACKWTELSQRQRSALIAVAGDTLGLLLRDSPVQLLILNGQSVVDEFQDIAGVRLEKQAMRDWTLPRRSHPEVLGFAYKGTVHNLSGVGLEREILVLGYNHNIQSSFGVTAQVAAAIQRWIAETVNEVIS
jgi:hypothetical protein